MTGRHDVTEAEAAAERVQADPQAAATCAERILARPGLSDEARTVTLWVLGLACRELGDLGRSRDWFARAIDTGSRAELPQRVATARMGLALTLANHGDFDEALEEIGRARPDVPPRDAARLDQQEALIRQRRGELDAARELYARALRAAGDGTDPLLECRALSNLGVLEGYAGNADRGVHLLTRALDRATALGQQLLAARAAHNLGFLEGRRGNVPAGLGWFDRGRAMYDELESPVNEVIVIEADRSELLLDAGLCQEAAERTTDALRLIGTKDDSIDTAELELLCARALLADRRPAEAEQAAHRAAAAFEQHGRDVWREVAQVFALDCRRLAGATDAGAWREAAAAAAALERAGVPAESIRARLLAVQLATQAGEHAAAREQLGTLPAFDRIGADADRAGAWLATAQVRLAAGDRTGAAEALRSGIEVVRAHQQRFGSFELRARAAEAGAEIAQLGLRLASADRDAEAMLGWLESWRAGALLLPPARASADAGLGDTLAELRILEADIAAAERAGRQHGLDERRRALEQVVRTRSHVLPATAADQPGASVEAEALDSALGARVLVEYFTLDGRLHAITRRSGRTEHRDLGAVVAVQTDVDHLRFAIDRLARGTRSVASQRAAESALAASASALDAALLHPLADLTAGADLVVVPTSWLHQLAWRALPTCRDGHAVVTPSARVWLAAERRAQRRRHEPGSLVVAGPDLAGAMTEVADVAGILSAPAVLTGERATVGAVSDALRTAAVAHIASHGSFRSDNAMFSALRLHDGSFSVYDLERLDSVPWLFVLPACQAGATSVYAGDELLGLSAALLGLGAAAVVAPVNPVPDHATRDLMVAFHTALAGGRDPATALTVAAEATAGASPQALAAAASFTLLGAGGPVGPRDSRPPDVSAAGRRTQEG